MHTVNRSRYSKRSITALVTVPAFLLLAASLISLTGVQAASPTVRTVTFAKSSSALNSNAKKLLLQWKPSLSRASKITVTGYAPNVGKTSVQKKLATNRALAVATQLKRLGLTATIAKNISLSGKPGSKNINADKATIVIAALKPSASPSSSATPTNSVSPSASASPSTEPAFKFSGSLILNFVDCNQAQKQLFGTSVTATPVQQGLSPFVFELGQSDTGHADNNFMNCAINWSDLDLPNGQYNVSIQVQCVEILDAEVPSSAVCTPSKYLRQDLQAQTTVALTGSGPTGQLGSYSMSINLPTQIEITQDKSVNYEAWLD